MSRHPSPALGVAIVALFVALGGTGYAAATGSIDSREIKNNTIRGEDVRSSSLLGGDVKNGSLSPADFTGSVKGDTGAPGQPGATGPQGATGATGATGPATGAAGGDLTGSYPNPLIAFGSVGPDEIASFAVGPTKLANDSVTSPAVAAGGLNADDNKLEGTDSLNFGSIAPGTCDTTMIDAGASVEGETVVTMPEESWPFQLPVTTVDAVTAEHFRVNVCNPTAAAVDPAATFFSWVVFDN